MISVIKAAKSGRLAVADDVRADLAMSANDPTEPRLLRMIDSASSRIATTCNRVFGRQIYRQRLMAPCGSFVLAAGPVNRIIRVGGADASELASDQFLLEGDVLKLAGVPIGIGDGSAYNLWRGGHVSFEVEFEAGWLLPGEDVGDDFTGTTPLPADIERAAIQMVGVAIAEAGRDPTIRSETVQGVGSATYAAQAQGSELSHPGAEAAIRPYRVFAFA